MRGALPILLLALLVASDAGAQQAQAPAPPQSPVLVQTCYAVLTIYGFLPVCVANPVDPAELDRRVADYLTNGAGALAVPSAGPAAAYFHDASKVLAAPTTSWIPTFPEAVPSPVGAPSTMPAPLVGLDSGAAAPPPSTEPAATRAGTPPSVVSWAIDETPSGAPAAATAPSAHDLRGSSGVAAALVASTPSPPPGATPVAESPTEPTRGPSVRKVIQPWWAAVASVVVLGAGVLFLVGRRVGRRLRAAHGRC